MLEASALGMLCHAALIFNLVKPRWCWYFSTGLSELLQRDFFVIYTYIQSPNTTHSKQTNETKTNKPTSYETKPKQHRVKNTPESKTKLNSQRSPLVSPLSPSQKNPNWKKTTQKYKPPQKKFPQTQQTWSKSSILSWVLLGSQEPLPDPFLGCLVRDIWMSREELCFDRHVLWNKLSCYFAFLAGIVYRHYCAQYFCFRIYVSISKLVLICNPRFVHSWLFPTWMKIISGRQLASVNTFSAIICTLTLVFSFCKENVPEITVFKNCAPGISVIRGKIALHWVFAVCWLVAIVALVLFL